MQKKASPDMEWIKDLAAAGAYWVAKQITDSYIPDAMLGAYVLGRMLEVDKKVREEAKSFWQGISKIEVKSIDLDTAKRIYSLVPEAFESSGLKKVFGSLQVFNSFEGDLFSVEFNGRPIFITDALGLAIDAGLFFEGLLRKAYHLATSKEPDEMASLLTDSEILERVLDNLILAVPEEQAEKAMEAAEKVVSSVVKFLNKLEVAYEVSAVVFLFGEASYNEIAEKLSFAPVHISKNFYIYLKRFAKSGRAVSKTEFTEISDQLVNLSAELEPLSLIVIDLYLSKDDKRRVILPNNEVKKVQSEEGK